MTHEWITILVPLGLATVLTFVSSIMLSRRERSQRRSDEWHREVDADRDKCKRNFQILEDRYGVYFGERGERALGTAVGDSRVLPCLDPNPNDDCPR